MSMNFDYETLADKFFGWLQKNEDGRATFEAMVTARIFKSARETGTPMEGAAPWLRGQISICDEFLNRMELASRASKEEATSDGQGGSPAETGGNL